MKRRIFLASSLAALGGCAPATNALTGNTTIKGWLESAESLNEAAIGTRGLARTYGDRDVDREFRVNGLSTPSDSTYTRLAAGHFDGYRLAVDGAVEHPQSFTFAQLRALQSLTQTTRHDCVEGWSAIGKWSGVPLANLLSLVKPAANARYVVFHCLDRDDSGAPYYESLSLAQAAHPQALLALDLNEKPLDPAHGAPVRLRVPTQLGYKSAKWVSRLELRDSLGGVFGGSGGYWEDQGYEWYAGI
jgi:DMSO/TMAO reductase YedYZ molybdopterin-dependent catalytic subunit